MLQQYQKIMIAIDGSDEADLAFKKAVNVAKRNDAELLLAHVVDTRSFQSVSSFDGALAEEAMSMAKETLDTYQQQAVDMGQTKVSSVLAYGSPKNIIAKELPKEYNIDLIMLGATGLNAVERLFIGSALGRSSAPARRVQPWPPSFRAGSALPGSECRVRRRR